MPKLLLRPPMRRDGERRDYSFRYSYGRHHSGYSRDRRLRQLNVPIAIISLLMMVIGIPAIYFWHDYQIKRLSVSLWDYGEKKAAEKDWEEAAAAFYRSWEIRQDPRLLADAVKAYDNLVARYDRPGLIAAYQRAIGGLPERLDLRTRLAELLLLERQNKLALTHAENVLAKDPKNLTAQRCRAIALLAMFRSNQPLHDVDVLKELERVYVQQPGDFDLVAALTSHIRDDLRAPGDSELSRRADRAMDRLVALRPRSVRARMLRYRYRSKHGLAGAKEDIAQAVLLAPENAQVLKEAAVGALRDAAANLNQGDYLTARQLFKEYIALRPTDEAGYLGLGDVEFLVQGNTEHAIAVWNQGRKQARESLVLLVRIAEAQSASYRFAELQNTLTEIEELIATMTSPRTERDRHWATASMALFRGKMQVARQHPRQAIEYFKQASELGEQPRSDEFRTRRHSIAFTALLDLGNTYRALGQSKAAADTFDRALKLEPDDETALLASAESWSLSGDLDRAIRQVERAMRLSRPSAEVFRARAQYLFERELGKTSAERDWQPFESALKIAQTKLSDSWPLRLLEVDYAVHHPRKNVDNLSKVLGMLLTIERDFPHSLPLWQRLPFIYQSLDLKEEADRALHKLETLTSSSASTKFLTIDLLLSRGDAEGARKVLHAIPTDALSRTERSELDVALLRILAFEADDDGVDAALASRCREDSAAVERLLKRRLIKVSTTSAPKTDALIKDLQRRQPTSQATWQYYVARIELEKADPDLAIVQKHLVSLTHRLPNWSGTQELEVRMAWAQGNQHEARKVLADVASKPRRDPQLIRLFVEHNVQARDFLANLRILEKLHQPAIFSRVRVSRQWPRLQQQLDFAELDRALRKRGLQRSAMWSALLSENALETGRAQQLDELMLALWYAVEKGEEPSDLLEQLRSFPYPTEDQRWFVLGQAYELVGQLPQAKQAYRRVLDDSVRRAEFYAASVSNRLMRPDIRRQDVDRSAQRSQTRLQAILKLQRASRNDLLAARELLQTLADTALDNELFDRLLLSNCLEQLGNLNGAVEQLEQVVARDRSAYHLSMLIDFMLRNGQHDDAEPWIDALERQTGWEPKTVLLRARWMVAANRSKSIRPFVEMFATERFKKRPRDPAKEMRHVSEIYRQIGFVDDAKRWREMLADRFPGQSGPLTPLLVEDDDMDRTIARGVQRLQDEPSVETAAILDTKAVALMHQHQFKAAADLLHEVTSSPTGNDPRFYLHLAMCLDRLNDRNGAAEALEEAVELGLDIGFLTDDERRELERLTKQLQGEQG